MTKSASAPDLNRRGRRPQAAVALLWIFAALAAGPPGATVAQENVRVNGELVTQAQFTTELGQYGIVLPAAVPDGNYWYDDVSGLWGVVGGPTLGQMPPGLELGGDLKEDASGGGTDIFINGRELHVAEAAYLQQIFGYALPGRYWMNEQGIGGVEGGPPLFNLVAAAQARLGGNSYTRRGLFGGTGSDGNCSYYMHPGGSSVMTGAC
jgi:hypothetical protein